jgi:hypothetical protein
MEMVDRQAVKHFFETKSLSYYTADQGSNPTPAHKHPCGGQSRWAGGPRF